VIGFSIPEGVETDLSIYSITGQKVVTLASGMRTAGDYRVYWDGRDGTGKEVASGVYLYRLRAGHYLKMRRLLLLR
jgi:flagellar hook assembly protein FlgD